MLRPKRESPLWVRTLEALRRHLGVDRWLLFGGSWGSTLALADAQSHAARVLGLVLRGIFLCGRNEIDWFLHGMGRVFPEVWRDFAEAVPADERQDLLAAYHRRLVDADPEVHPPAARAWSGYEAACSTLLPSPETGRQLPRRRRRPAPGAHRGALFRQEPVPGRGRAAGRHRPGARRAGRHRAGALRHRLPDRHRRYAGARLAGSALRGGARRRPLGDGARYPRRAGGGDGGLQAPRLGGGLRRVACHRTACQRGPRP